MFKVTRKRAFCPDTRQTIPVVEFEPRFVHAAHLAELSSLWALSRTARGSSRYDRLVWTAGEFAKIHSYVTATGVYKDLDAMLVFGGR